MSGWPLDGVFTKLPGLVTFEFVLDSYVGPDGNIWVLWYKQASGQHWITRYTPDMVVLGSWQNTTAKLTNPEWIRGSIVVTRNNIAVVAYQTQGGGGGTWVRTVSTAGALGTEVLMSGQYLSWPQLALYNGCEDVIAAFIIGSGAPTTYAVTISPFKTSTQTKGTNIVTPVISGLLYSYAGPKCISVDPTTNEIHFVTYGSSKSFANPSLSPLDIVHVRQNGATWVSDYWEPPLQTPNNLGSYALLVLRSELSKDGSGDMHIVYHDLAIPYNLTFQRKSAKYAHRPKFGSWTLYVLYEESLGFQGGGGVYTGQDLSIDADHNIHIVLCGTECSKHHRSYVPGNTCAYLGVGLQYVRRKKTMTSWTFEPEQLVIKGLDVCGVGYGDLVTVITPTIPRGFPTSAKLTVLTRISNNREVDACAAPFDGMVYSQNTDLWTAGVQPPSGEVNCESFVATGTVAAPTIFTLDLRRDS